MRRRPAALLAAIGALLCAGSAFVTSPVGAQAARSVTVTPPDQLVDGQYVDVSLSGFPPNRDVRIRLCAANAAAVGDCAVESARPQDPGASRIVRTDSNGSGSSPFVIKAQDVDRVSGGSKFQCDAENPCKLYVFELDLDGNETAFANSASATLSYALSTIPCPETEPRVAGSGASAIRYDFFEWQAETCEPPLSANVSYATSNSVNGKQAFVQGLTDADFAISAIALTDAERTSLATRKIQPLHVPVALGSLVLAYNLWIQDSNGTIVQVKDLQLSPDTAAGIMNGTIGQLSDPAIKADNIDKHPNGFVGKLIVPVARADNSAATWWLSSWFTATARAAWESAGDVFKGGPTTIFPAAARVDLRTGTSAVAQDLREFPGQEGSNGIPEPAMIGVVYYSDALKLGLPVVALKNAAGNYVKPTTESVTAAAAAGSVSSDGIFTPNFTTTDRKAYPLPVVTYAIAPKAGGPLDPPHELVLQKFLHYAVNDGQKKAELRGYAPLPANLKTKSDLAVGEIYAAPTPTPAPKATSAPASHGSTGVVSEAGASTPAPQVAAADQTAGGAVGSAAAAPEVPAASGTAPPSAPVKKVVTGLLKLLGGGSAPVTASGFLWFGAIIAIVGRAMSVAADRRAARRRSMTAGLRVLERDQ